LLASGMYYRPSDALRGPKGTGFTGRGKNRTGREISLSPSS
jgi:hypothetical protein